MLIKSSSLSPTCKKNNKILSMCAFSSLTLLVIFTLFFFSSTTTSSVEAQQQKGNGDQKNNKNDPHVGPGGQLPKEKQGTFMPNNYNPEAAPPKDFDPSKPPPGFDEEAGSFTDKKKQTSNSNTKANPAEEQAQRQKQAENNDDERYAGLGGDKEARYPGGVSQDEIARVAREYERRQARGETIPDDDEDLMVWGTTQGGGNKKKKDGKAGGKKIEPPKGKKGQKIAHNPHIGEEIKTTPRLEAVKKEAPYLFVLYHAPSWPWCESCFALENATRTARLVVDRWASYSTAPQKDKKNKKNNNNGKKSSGDEQIEKEDEALIREFHDASWNSAPTNAAARFAWVDCSASGIHGPFHPCADVKSFPAIGLFVHNSDTPLHWYDGFTDSFSVLNWIRAKVPNATNLVMTDEMKQQERGMIERKKLDTQASLIQRYSPKDISEKARTEPVLALLYEQDCRTCSEDTILLETVARFNALRKKQQPGGPSRPKRPDAVTEDDSDSPDEHEMPLIARIPIDDKVRARWLGSLDVPQIAFFDATSPSTPQLYFGQRNATDLLAYVRYVSRLDVRVPKLPLNSKAVSAHPNVFGPNSNLRIHSAEELRKFLDETKLGNQRLLYVHSSWQRPSEVTAEAGDAVDAFHIELARRKGSQAVEFRVLLLCALRPNDRNQILDMKIFSRRSAPFFILINGPRQKAPEFINMRVTRANLALFGEEMRWLATPSPRVPTTNVSVGHYFIEFNTLAPLVVPEKVDQNTLLLPFDFYSDREDFFIFVSTSNGGVESVTANDRGLIIFDKASREIKRLLDQEVTLAADARQKIEKQVKHNISFGVIDISRFPEVKTKVPAGAEEIANGMPVVIQLKRKKDSAGFEAPVLVEFGSALKPMLHAPWDSETGYRAMLASFLKIASLPDHPDTDVVELTSSNFERKVLDPTMGVLIMFYSGNNDPHSDSMMTPFRKVGAAFRKDSQIVLIAQLDVERIDAATRKEYQLTHVPAIRWFAKGSYDKGIGESFPGTPFTESMIEYVSEEMDLPYFDLEQMRSGGDGEFPPVMYKDFDSKISHEMQRHVVLYLSRGRFRNEAKLSVLQRMQKHFDAHRDFQNNFTFARIDAIRYSKKLRKSGLIVDPDDLPMLVSMPPGINKFQKIVKFPMMEKPFAEPTLARWVADVAEYPILPDVAFNYTEDELDRERDPPITGISDLDQTNFMEFVAGKGDRIVMFYAPWCKSSREFMPTFSKVANHFEGDDKIAFGRIDVPQNEEIGHQQGIQAFPTIIIYFDGSARKFKYQGEVYPGGPSGEGMIEYLTTIRQSSRVQALETYRQSRNKLVLQLNSTTFQSKIENGTMHALVEFGVDWCGHCRHLETVMEDLAEIHASNRNRLLVNYIDCDNNRETCKKYNITDNYPKLMLFRRDALKGPDGKPPKTLPVRAEFLYKEHRFFDEIQGFMAAQVPDLVISSQQKTRFGNKRNREETDFFDKLAESKKSGNPVKFPGIKTAGGSSKRKGSATSGMQQTAATDTPEAKKRKEEERRRIEEEEIEQSIKDGKVRPGSAAFSKPKFTSFPAHVALLDYDSFIKHISNNKLLVVLNYEEPEDNDEMVSFAMMATSLQPLVERKMLQLGAIAGSGGDAGVTRLLGRHPSISFFRGLSTPSHVRFDTSSFAVEGEGGDLLNVSHLLKFVEKNLKNAGKTSYELTAQKYDIGTQDPDFSTVVFFYAPWDETCRKVAEKYDAVAQILGHHEHIVLTRVDISRSSTAYNKLGKRALPAIYIYDQAAKKKAKEYAWENDLPVPKPVTPRYLTKNNPTREEIVQFIVADDPKSLKEREDTGYLHPKPGDGEKVVDILEDQDNFEDGEFKDLLKAVREEEERGRESAKKIKERKKKEGDSGSSSSSSSSEESADIMYMPALTANELDGTRYAPLTIPTTQHFHITMREFPQGALIFFTAEYCAHCPKFEDMYQQAIGPMRNLVVVALFDVTQSKAVMRRCGVKSLPALVYVRPGSKPGDEDDELTLVHFTGQKTIEEFVKFGLANVQGLPKPQAGSIPPYPEMKTPDVKPSEESAKDLELIQRGRVTAEELVTNATSVRELDAVMYSASTVTAEETIKGVLFVFVSSWCGDSCTRVREVATVVANAMENSMRVVVVNVTEKAEFRTIQQAYDIRSVPLLAIRCVGDDGSLKRIQGSQLTLRGAGWVRKSSENIAVLFEGFCMKRYSKEQLRSLSSMVPEAVVREVAANELPKLRHDTGLLVFIRNAKSCSLTYDCRETQKAIEQLAVKSKKFKDKRAQFIFVDSTGEKVFKSALKQKQVDLPAIVYLEQRAFESEESDQKTWLSVLVTDMFMYESSLIPTVELLDSFITQQVAREKATGV